MIVFFDKNSRWGHKNPSQMPLGLREWKEAALALERLCVNRP